ncbi:ras guanine nucleotide exchange factor P-like [Tigriopus californicus]|uniref:ras guanine nucleotide exchange factor P-like n=1 Tax=Tigriopus californicus TaxID=6832 RepID=UPI0027DA670E|nr:ras guanine nucleotide exchange factor P-like [Tigriopus californicus]
MDVKLRSAESAINFLQSEHKSVLSGLHEEIQRLQQKCSDLQFALSSAASAEQSEAEWRLQVQRFQSLLEQKEKRIASVEHDLASELAKTQDLAEQLKWREMEFENQLRSKNAKIESLQKSLQVQSEVGRLQSACKKLYEEREQEFEDKMKSVVEKAKGTESSPLSSPQQPLSRSLSLVESSLPTRPMPVIRPLPDLTTTRSKLFRHKLQKSLKNTSVDKYDPLANDILLCSLDERQLLKYHRPSLPNDYRSSVATLPPITHTRPNSVISATKSSMAFAEVETLEIGNNNLGHNSSGKDDQIGGNENNSHNNNNNNNNLSISTTESMA